MKKLLMSALLVLSFNTFFIKIISNVNKAYYNEFTLMAMGEIMPPVDPDPVDPDPVDPDPVDPDPVDPDPVDPDPVDPDPVDSDPVDPDPDPIIGGYKTSYLVIPAGIDISDLDEFYITGINDKGETVTESILEEDAVDGENKILLNNDVSGSAPEGFKVVEVKVPEDDGENVKFSAGYKFQENGVVTEYVFLVEDDPSEDDAKENTKVDPFELIDPSKYSYDTFPGIEGAEGERYFMTPVRDTTKNFDLDFYSSEVPFKINEDGSIEVLVPFNLTVDILGAEYNGGDIHASAHIKLDDNWQSIKTWSNDLRRSGNRTTYEYLETLPAGTEVGISTWVGNGTKRKSWIDSDVFGPNDTRGYIEVHRNDGEIKNIRIDPVDGQESLEKIVGNLVTIAEDGKAYANIGPQDIMILTEHATNNPSYSYYDLQDLVALITLTAADSGPIYRITLVHDEGLLSEEKANMISESSSSNRKRISDVEFRVMETGTSEVEFEITNIED